jgi:hypothetical protein
MQPINFPGAKIIGKPEDMTDEQCMSIPALPLEVCYGKNAEGQDIIGRVWVEAWKPSREDIEAINRGEPIYIQIHSTGLPPVSMFTLDINGNSNDAG